MQMPPSAELYSQTQVYLIFSIFRKTIQKDMPFRNIETSNTKITKIRTLIIQKDSMCLQMIQSLQERD